MAKKIKDGRSIHRDELARLRVRAIELRKKKWSVNDIAESFGVHRGSVSRWFNRFRHKGLDGLKRRKAPGAKPKLSVEETAELLFCMRHSACDYGFATPLWDCHRVQQLIRSRFETTMDPSGVWRLLRRWRLTPQKPEKHAYEQDEKIVANWLANEWPKIQAQAKKWRAIVYFQDEAGVSLIPALGKTWAPRGKTPHVVVSGKRGGVTVTSAVSPSGRLLFRLENQKVVAETHAEFLQQLMNHHPRRKIIVIEDRAPQHRANLIEELVNKNKRRFARYFIPSYSPELNFDEKTWRHLKKHELKTHQATTLTDLRSLVLSKMRSIQRRPKIIKSFFNDSYVT